MRHEIRKVCVVLALLLCMAGAAVSVPVRTAAAKSTQTDDREKNGLVLQGKRYVLYKKGVQVTKEGWKELSGEKIRIGGSGYVIARMKRVDGIWKFYKYNAGAAAWERQKDVWKTVFGRRYYFNASGICMKIYNEASEKLAVYSKGKMISAKNKVFALSSGKLYFFNAKSVRTTTQQWQKVSDQYYQVGSNGYIVSKIVCKDGKWKYYKYNYKTPAWERQKNVCITLEQKEYYFDNDGVRIKSPDSICYYNNKGDLIREIDFHKPMVALTYDDGPSRFTPIVLDVLEKYNCKATFFVVGRCVPLYPDALRRATQMGCEIGNHSYGHQSLTTLAPLAVQNEMIGTNALVKSVTGISPILMRPPGGANDEMVRSNVGMPLILWTIDTLDWKTKSVSATQAAVLNNIKDGDIVLMHDSHGTTAEASKTIIPELVKRGYQLVTVSELAGWRGGAQKGVVYRQFPQK